MQSHRTRPGGGEFRRPRPAGRHPGVNLRDEAAPAPPGGRTAHDAARETGPALESWYRFVLWLVPALERFPRRQKFLLGDRIQNAALDVLESLIEATYTRRRETHLARANLGIEKLRFLARLAMDLHYLDPRRYEHAARALDETGRKVGAWRKTHRARAGGEDAA